MPIFLVIFVILPLLEISVFIAVGEYIGLFTTLSLAFLTAILGGFIVKYQGLQTLQAIRESLRKGKMPAAEIFDGFCLVAAGATLITPGFVTDTIGFLLLIPPVRDVLRAMIKKHTNWFIMTAQSETVLRDGSIEGEYERVDEDNKD